MKKVTIQPGCKELCAAAVACKFMDGPDSGNGTSPSPAPPPKEGDGEQGFAPPADASSGKPSAPDAGNGDQAMEMDAGSMADVSGAPPMDAGTAVDSGTQQASEIEQCEVMCSVWKLEQVAAPELTALEQCIAAHKVCADMNVACVANAEAFQKAASENDLWMLGLGGTTESTGGTKNDADATSAGSTDTATAPQAADTASSADSKLAAPDGAGTAAATPASSSSSSGCTAAPAGANSPWALAGLGLIGLAFVWLRRRATV
jgi:MYXO-CTERM domain-containing protein